MGGLHRGHLRKLRMSIATVDPPRPAHTVHASSSPSQKGLCAICLAAAASHAFDPCFHLCVCGPCSERLVHNSSSDDRGSASIRAHAVDASVRILRCPICRVVATKCVRIYT